MKKISKGSCKTASHRLFRDKAKNHVDDINEFLLMLNQSQHQHDFLLLDECKHSIFGVPSIETNNSYGRPTFESECHQFDLNDDFNRSCYAAFNGTDFRGEDAVPHIPTYLPSLCPPSAFLLRT
jgi:hypothetical protein